MSKKTLSVQLFEAVAHSQELVVKLSDANKALDSAKTSNTYYINNDATLRETINNIHVLMDLLGIPSKREDEYNTEHTVYERVLMHCIHINKPQ
jgi:hypothetical protein